MEETVPAQIGEMPKLLMKAAERGKVEQKVELSEELTAPVRKGDIVGKVTYRVGGEAAAQVEITAAGDVEEVTFSSVFPYLLQSFFTM